MTTKSEEKKPALFLWLLCHITIIIFPLALFISVVLARLGMTDSVLAFLIGTFIAFQIVGLYSRLDYEVTKYVMKKHKDD